MAEVIQSELSSGTTLCGGKYVIEAKIGSGGFGITYLARHTVLDRKYAIKEFFMNGYNVRNNTTNHVSLQGIDFKDYDRIKQTFINEARTLAHLNNDAIVKVIDIFDENGTSYMVMPFVEGTTLKRMVEKDGPMEYEIAVNYMVQICEALKYIHSKDILHRDVTPDNVIVTPEQKIVLIDFGSARKFIDNKTQRQTTIVKSGYAPLEQHSARSRKGAFTDIYSVGAVFYYLLTGERPIDATERVLEKMAEPIELNPNIPLQINSIIMKAMEMDGEKRYQSAQELINDIFSDGSIDSEEHTIEVVETKTTDNQPEKDATTGIQRKTKSAKQNLNRKSKALDIIKKLKALINKVSNYLLGWKNRKNKTKTEDNENKIAKKSRGVSMPLVITAVILALMAVAAVVTLIIYHPYSSDNPQNMVDSPTENTLIKYKLSTGKEYFYEGETDSLGIPNGYGTAIFDSCIYLGYFKDGDMNGYGTLSFKLGEKKGWVYNATFEKNRICRTCTCIVALPLNENIGSFIGEVNDNWGFHNGWQTDLEGNRYKWENDSLYRE